MKSVNTLGNPISPYFNSAFDSSSLTVKPQVTIEFGNNSFNSTAQTDQTTTASSTKSVDMWPTGATDVGNFWGPAEAFNNKNRNSMYWAVLDCGATAWGPDSPDPPYRCVCTDDLAGNYEHGWWSAKSSFPATVQSIFTYGRNINQVGVWTDEAYANMSSITVYYYNGSTWISLGTITPTPTAYYNTVNMPSYPSGTLCYGLKATVNSSYGSDGFARICELQGYMTVDVSADVISFDLEQNREQYDSTVPVGLLMTGSLNLILQNTDQKYSPFNASGPYYPYIGENNRIVLSVGIDETPVGLAMIEYVQMGEFWSDQWDIDGQNTQASVGCRDYGKFMQDQLVPFSKVWQNQNLNIPIRDLLARVGKAPSQINIDQYATRTFPLLYVFNESYWNFLGEVALADQGTFGFDGLGDFFYYTYSRLSQPPYTSSQFTFSPSANIIDASQETQLILNIIQVDVNPINPLDFGVEALWQENTQRTIPATVGGGTTGTEASQPTLSWNYLAADIGSTDMTIPCSISNEIQDMYNPYLGGDYNSIYILIDNEVIYCDSVDDNNFYVYAGDTNFPVDPVNNPNGRGWARTTAASHSSGAYIGQCEYYESALYDRGPALAVNGVYCTAIDGLELAYGPGMAQAKIILFVPDLFKAELCIANIVPAFTPLKASGIDSFNPTTMMYRGASGTTGANGDQLNWVTSINGVGLLQRSSPRRIGTGNLTNRRQIRRHGRHEIEINNPWIQTDAHARQLANFMNQQYNVPRSVVTLNAIANPILDLSDRVTISSYPEGGITNIDYNIINISYRYDGGLTAQYSLKEVYVPGSSLPLG